MDEVNFDVGSLATFLHILPAQVAKLADRGKLPGRKVGGQWRFSSAEVHHWLERQIGISDGNELVQMEEILHASAPQTAEKPPLVRELLAQEAVAVPLNARTRGSAISEMTRLAAETGLLWDPEKMASAVRDREEMHPTVLDNGVALLHPRRPMSSILAEPLLALGITPRGIPFGGRGGALTDIFFLICSTDDRCHLQILARLSRVITTAGFLPAIRAAESAAAAHALIAEHDEELG